MTTGTSAENANKTMDGEHFKHLCNRCGYCCKYIINIYPMSADTVEWAQARGFECLDSSEHYLMVRIPSPCPHLKMKKGKWSCTCDPKPKSCVLYPRFLDNRKIAEMGLSFTRSLGSHCGYLSEFTERKANLDEHKRRNDEYRRNPHNRRHRNVGNSSH